MNTDRPRCPHCESPRLRSRNDGQVRCYGCRRLFSMDNLLRGKIAWKDIPRTHFNCGHERTPDNIYQAKNGPKRCKTCKNELNRRYYKPNSTLDTKPLLELVWR